MHTSVHVKHKGIHPFINQTKRQLSFNPSSLKGKKSSNKRKSIRRPPSILAQLLNGYLVRWGDGTRCTKSFLHSENVLICKKTLNFLCIENKSKNPLFPHYGRVIILKEEEVKIADTLLERPLINFPKINIRL